MAAMKKVVVQLGGYNRVVHVDCTNETSEREALLKRVREAFCDRINIAADDCVTLQIKDDEWQGMYIDFFANDVPDRAVLKVIVERPEVCLDCTVHVGLCSDILLLCLLLLPGPCSASSSE